MCIVSGETFCRQACVCAVHGLYINPFNFALLFHASDNSCMSSSLDHSLFSLSCIHAWVQVNLASSFSWYSTFTMPLLRVLKVIVLWVTLQPGPRSWGLWIRFSFGTLLYRSPSPYCGLASAVLLFWRFACVCVCIHWICRTSTAYLNSKSKNWCLNSTDYTSPLCFVH